MQLDVLPLAITMLAGPQIITAVIFVTSENAVRTSAAFVLAVAIGVTAGVTITWGIAEILGNQIDFGDPDSSSSGASLVQIILVALLVLNALRSYLQRETAEPPKWLTGMMGATPRKAFVTGLALITLFPSDLVVLFTVGFNVSVNGADPLAAIPFIAATVAIAASPLLAYLLLGARARRTMPKVRDWMNSHSWVISIAASLIFIALILG